MKKLITAAIAVFIGVTPAAASTFSGNGSTDRTVETLRDAPIGTVQASFPKRFPERSIHGEWYEGDRFDRRFAVDAGIIVKPRNLGLEKAPDGQRWIKAGKDALLVDKKSQMITLVVRDVF